MRGHIKSRYKGTYSIVLNLGRDPSTGKRKQQWISVKGTKKEAERKLSDILHQLDTGTFMKPGKTTVGDFLERWLGEYVWPNLSPRTAEGYENIMRRHLVPALGSIPLTQLKPEHLQRYYSEKLSGGLSAQTVRHHHTALHKALQTAVEWGMLSRNVADAVRAPRAQRPEMHTLNEDDIQTLLEAAKPTPYYPFFYMALFTGMRRSELLALRWSDVDLLLCQVHITRTLHHLQNGEIVFGAPKTDKGRRMVSLTPSTALVLRAHREKQEATRLMLGGTLQDDDLIFSDFSGKPFLPNAVTHAWIKLVRRNGLKGIRLHDCRHTHASLLLKAGVHPKIVQERLGHASIQITLDTYSHVAPGLQEAAAARFDALVTPRQKAEAKNEAVVNSG